MTGLDYYAIDRNDGQVVGILVEDFRFDEDPAAVRLHGTMWTVSEPEWLSSFAFSRAIRVDAGARGCVRAITRAEAEAHFARLGGDDLPGEPALRALFGADSSFASPPLRLGSGTAAAGYRETRVYRLLFADEPRSLAELQSTWPMRAVSDGRVVGTVDRAIGRDALRWDLRHIGPGAAWCVDLTVNLAGDDDGVIGPVLRELTAVMRGQGMIPVTIERFS